jgi:hypothetical protein
MALQDLDRGPCVVLRYHLATPHAHPAGETKLSGATSHDDEMLQQYDGDEQVAMITACWYISSFRLDSINKLPYFCLQAFLPSCRTPLVESLTSDPLLLLPPQPLPNPHQRLPQSIISPLALPPLRLLAVEPNPPDLVVWTGLNQNLLPGPEQHFLQVLVLREF